MNVELVRACENDRAFVQDIARFYVYETARVVGPDPEWAVDRDWLYDARDYGYFWDDGNHPFLIHADGDVAGFCLIDRFAIVPGIDWNMGEFFVLGPYGRRGIGRQAATQAFRRFPGQWQVSQVPWNTPAIAFWRRVIGDYTGGDVVEQSLPDPRGDYPSRNVMTFESPPHQA